MNNYYASEYTLSQLNSNTIDLKNEVTDLNNNLVVFNENFIIFCTTICIFLSIIILKSFLYRTLGGRYE